MNDYINQFVAINQDKVSRIALTPAKGNLFDEDDGTLANKLVEKDAEKFHHTTAKLLYASKRAQIDIMAVSYERTYGRSNQCGARNCGPWLYETKTQYKEFNRIRDSGGKLLATVHHVGKILLRCTRI